MRNIIETTPEQQADLEKMARELGVRVPDLFKMAVGTLIELREFQKNGQTILVAHMGLGDRIRSYKKVVIK